MRRIKQKKKEEKKEGKKEEKNRMGGEFEENAESQPVQAAEALEAPAEQRDYSAINDALAQMDADGTLSRLSVKYFGMDISEEQ